MNWLREVARRLRMLMHRREFDADLEEEMQLHLELRQQEQIESGMTPDDARAAARRGFGNVTSLKEKSHMAWGWGWFEQLVQDIRYGLRMLRKNPALTSAAIVSLALGIGANTAVFSMVNAVLLRPLPYDQPQQLMKIWGRFANEGIPQNWISEPELWDMRDRLRSFSALAAYSAGDGANLNTKGSEPVRIVTAESTFSLWSLLRVTPLLGRTYSADDDLPGRNRVAVLAYGFWSQQFGSDPNIIGKSMQLDAETYTVIGVLPKEFAFAGPNDLWLPLGLDRPRPQDRGSHYLQVIARLRPGVTLARAAAELDGFAAQLELEYPDNYDYKKGFGMALVPLHTEIVGDRRTALLVLFVAVAFVLLIACANLANLLLARGSTRTKEIALRVALGARRTRIIRQLLTESVLISVFGGVSGLALSAWSVGLLRSMAPALSNTPNVAVDGRVLLFAVAILIFTGVLFGLAPALHLSAPVLHDVLKDASRSSLGAGGQKLRSGLVVAEISMALVLLMGAGLLVRSLQRLVEVSPGFHPQHVLTANVTIPPAKYADGAPLSVFFRTFTERIRSLPGVQGAAAASLIPMTQRNSSGSTYAEHTSVQGLPLADWSKARYIETDRRYVTSGYFETMKIPLVRGRSFTDADNENGPPVAIVDERFAQRFWPGQDPLGQRIAIGSIPNSDPPQPQWRTVIGVVGHIRNDKLDQLGREQCYVPQTQVVFVRSMYLVVRTTIDPGALTNSIRTQLASLDPTIPLYNVKTMDSWLDGTLAERRFNMLLLSAFGALALVLAAIGIYGVLSYSVSQRTREIGIRMALGASRRKVLGMVVASGCRLALIGIAVGAVVALAATRVMASLLFGVGAADPLTFGVVTALLMIVTLLAVYLPAHRAMRADPMVALRYE